MNDAKAKFFRWLPFLLVAGVALISVVVVMITDEPTKLDPSSPEGTVQAYVEAVLDGDDDAAAAWLAEEALSQCRPGYQAYRGEEMRINLIETIDHNGTADVVVSIITSSNNGLLGPDEYSEQGRFDLRSTEDGWRIERAPWQLVVCPPTPPEEVDS